jgi:hypothetical protein
MLRPSLHWAISAGLRHSYREKNLPPKEKRLSSETGEPFEFCSPRRLLYWLGVFFFGVFFGAFSFGISSSFTLPFSQCSMNAGSGS